MAASPGRSFFNSPARDAMKSLAPGSCRNSLRSCSASANCPAAIRDFNRPRSIARRAVRSTAASRTPAKAACKATLPSSWATAAVNCGSRPATIGKRASHTSPCFTRRICTSRSRAGAMLSEPRASVRPSSTGLPAAGPAA